MREQNNAPIEHDPVVAANFSRGRPPEFFPHLHQVVPAARGPGIAAVAVRVPVDGSGDQCFDPEPHCLDASDPYHIGLGPRRHGVIDPHLGPAPIEIGLQYSLFPGRPDVREIREPPVVVIHDLEVHVTARVLERAGIKLVRQRIWEPEPELDRCAHPGREVPRQVCGREYGSEKTQRQVGRRTLPPHPLDGEEVFNPPGPNVELRLNRHDSSLSTGISMSKRSIFGTSVGANPCMAPISRTNVS